MNRNDFEQLNADEVIAEGAKAADRLREPHGPRQWGVLTMTEPIQHRKVYDLVQAAEVLADVSVDFLRSEYRSGRIAFKRLGKKYVVTDAELERYIADLDAPAPSRRAS